MPACIYQSALLVRGDTRAVSPQTNRPGEQSVQHAAPHPPPSQDLALMHAHGPDMLSPKGPCPVVTEQLPPTHSFSHRPACSAGKKKNPSQLLISSRHLLKLRVKFIKKSLHAVFSFLAFIFCCQLQESCPYFIVLTPPLVAVARLR